MKPELSEKFRNAKKSPVQEIMAYARPEYLESIGIDPKDLISFAGGWVNHPSPEPLRRAYERIVADPDKFHRSGGYSSILGVDECKAALVEYERYLYGVRGLTSANIVLSANSTQLTSNLLTILMDRGDKILLLDPAYCALPTQIKNAIDTEIIRFPVMDTESWRYRDDERAFEFGRFIKEAKPKVTLLISPDNPTSQIPSDRFVGEALRAMEHVGGFLAIDFAYKDMIFSDSMPEYYSWGPTDNFLSIHSNSKWMRSLGRRLGWAEASEEVVKALDLAQGASILSPDTLHQLTLADYLKSSIRDGSLKDYVDSIREQYRKAAEHTVHEIKRNLGMPCLTPQGGIYTCVKIGSDSQKFVEDVLKGTGVLFIPGSGFGESQRDAIRVSFGPLVNDLERITLGLEKVGKFLRDGGMK